MNGKFLITTDNWFIGPDGKSYKAAWGEVEVLQDSFLGIKTNSRSANWYMSIGEKDKRIIVAGCQVHYAVKCEDKPNEYSFLDEIDYEGETKEVRRVSRIYIAE